MASLIQRDGIYYLQWCVSGRVRRRSLLTSSLQIAREHQRQFESAQLRGVASPLPSRTSIADVVDRYVTHMRTIKTAKSAQTDVYYLREAFGPMCDALKITSRRVTEKCRKRSLQPDACQDLRVRPLVIEATDFESITSAQISAFISSHTRSRGLAPKTANRYREILVRLFNWAQKEGGVRMPGGVNPAASVERYKERAPQISFLTLAQIEEQLNALNAKPKLQTMVAVLIFAGLRREELIWLTHDDIDLKSGTHGIIRVRAKTVNHQSWQPKTKCNRAVPISSRLRQFLNRYTPEKSKHGWYFPSPEGKWWERPVLHRQMDGDDAVLHLAPGAAILSLDAGRHVPFLRHRRLVDQADHAQLVGRGLPRGRQVVGDDATLDAVEHAVVVPDVIRQELLERAGRAAGRQGDRLDAFSSQIAHQPAAIGAQVPERRRVRETGAKRTQVLAERRREAGNLIRGHP